MPDKTRLDKCSGTPGRMDSSFNNAMPINMSTATCEQPKLAKMIVLTMPIRYGSSSADGAPLVRNSSASEETCPFSDRPT
jgi:hypothetical protein